MKTAQVIIVGGGLAGLTTGLGLLQAGIAVCVIEKNTYPKHKVCGEYISNEVLPYLKQLDINPLAAGATTISQLQCSSLYGQALEVALPLGGFGISRYTLDHLLYSQFIVRGGSFIQDEVTKIHFENNSFQLKTNAGKTLEAGLVVGAYGKRSKIDSSLSRNFIQQKTPWLGVKMHYKAPWDRKKVALHNFKGGYCGISQVEDKRINVCYLAHIKTFKKYKNTDLFREEILRKNQYLDRFLKEAEPLFEQPLTISQISFHNKERVYNHILMCGDSASLIHPLCGNGMAMAIMGAQILTENIKYHLVHKTCREALENQYEKNWQKAFNSRLKWGKTWQKLLTSSLASTYGISFLKYTPGIVKQMVKTTHGKPLNS